MKKLLVLSALMLALSLSACGGGNTPKDDGSSKESQTQSDSKDSNKDSES